MTSLRSGTTSRPAIRAFRACRMALAAPILLVLLAAMPAGAGEVLVHAGWIHPEGDLKEGFLDTPRGFGADPKLEVGFGWRGSLGGAWSVVPTFTFVDYGDAQSGEDETPEYRTAVTSYRYLLEIRRDLGGPRGLRPFLAGGAGIFRNRLEGVQKGLADPVDSSVTTLGFSLRAGLRLGSLEVGACWFRNRFSSWRLWTTERELDYDWDSFSVRLTWAIPTGA